MEEIWNPKISYECHCWYLLLRYVDGFWNVYNMCAKSTKNSTKLGIGWNWVFFLQKKNLSEVLWFVSIEKKNSLRSSDFFFRKKTSLRSSDFFYSRKNVLQEKTPPTEAFWFFSIENKKTSQRSLIFWI